MTPEQARELLKSCGPYRVRADGYYLRVVPRNMERGTISTMRLTVEKSPEALAAAIERMLNGSE